MRKWFSLLVLAWLPLTGNPTWGQAPSVGINSSHEKPDNAPRAAQAPAERGTKENPLVVDTLGHQQTPVEREEAEQQAAKAEGGEQYHHRVDRWSLWWSGMAAIATAALVLVGIGGTVAAVCNLRALREQINLSKQQMDVMISNERARLQYYFGGLEVTSLSSKTWGLDVPIKIRNIGQSRAYGVQIHFRFECAIGDGPVGEEADFSYAQPPEGFLDPSDKYTEILLSMGGIINDLEEFASKVADRGHRLHLSGFINYETLGKNETVPIAKRIWNPVASGVPASDRFNRIPRSQESRAEKMMDGIWQTDPKAKNE